MVWSPSASKRFRLSLEKFIDTQVDAIYLDMVKDFDTLFDNWALDVKAALSVKAPASDMKGWAPTRDRSRRFPYERNGELKDSLRFSMDTHRTKKSLMITANVGFDSPHAYYTNEGIKAPRYVAQGAWVGWADDIFTGSGRDGVKSVRDLFNEFTKIRRRV